MIRVTDLRSFVEKSNLVHGNDYDYSDTVYVNAKTKVKIKHNKCGFVFEQHVGNHIKGHGCRYCAGQFLNTELFILKAKKVHSCNEFDYTDTIYTRAKNKLKIKCNSCLNIFEQTGDDHLRGYGCSFCGGTKKKNFNEFYLCAKEKHGNKFEYREDEFSSLKEKMNILCKACGEIFYQQPKKHLTGDGCPKCRLDSMGWKKSDFIRFCEKNNNGMGIIYLIQCFNQNESFFKIGITSKTVEYRYHSRKSMPYEYKILSQLELPALDTWSSERTLMTISKEHKYSPIIPFGGSVRECFSELNNQVLSFFGVSHA